MSKQVLSLNQRLRHNFSLSKSFKQFLIVITIFVKLE